MTIKSRGWFWVVMFLLLSCLAMRAQADMPAASASPASSVEDFKGNHSNSDLQIGALGGLGVIDSSGGFALVGTLSKVLISRGFVSDINDQVLAEIELGPMFTSGTTAFLYSTHLRWDFLKDATWTFYALGGLAGNITGAKLGNRWELFPRFGAGALWNIGSVVTLRGELSHEMIVAGASFGF